MHGFMSSGAQKIAPGFKTPMGMMSSGAVPQFRKERFVKPLKEEGKSKIISTETTEVKVTTTSTDVPIDMGTSTDVQVEVKLDYTSMHVKTLKKIALEKGYTGEKFDKGSLVDFLNSLLCSTPETTKPLSE